MPQPSGAANPTSGRRLMGRRAGGLMLGIAALLTVAVAGSLALADTDDAGTIPANACPEANAIYAEAGLAFDTYADRCPTPEEARADVDRRSADETSLDAVRTNTLASLQTVLDRAQAGELEVDGFEQEEVVATLKAVISLTDDAEVTSAEEEALAHGRANELLDALRASGDFPSDPEIGSSE